MPGKATATGGTSARSAPVNTAITPGAFSAALTSTDVIRAWATADRTKCTWQAPASCSSSRSAV